MSKNKKTTMYDIKTTLYHKVQHYVFDSEEISKLRKAITYAESATLFTISLLEYSPDAIILNVKYVPEKEKETAIETVTKIISAYMVVESEKVRYGLRKNRMFMFKGKKDCPIEITICDE